MTGAKPPAGAASGVPQIFDRSLIRRRRRRAAANLGAHDFLLRHAVAELANRLLNMNRHFESALEMGAAHAGLDHTGARRRIGALVRMDLAEETLRGCAGPALVADEERLPLAAGCLDLIVSVLALHRVNDIIGALIQMRRALRADGLFLAAVPGAGTLGELRRSLEAAELEISGGISPRIAPFADVRDLGGLLQRAGFADPVADRSPLQVRYADPLALMAELRGMGETNPLAARRRRPPRRAMLQRAAQIYRERFALPGGRIPATFETVYLTGWAPKPEAPRSRAQLL